MRTRAVAIACILCAAVAMGSARLEPAEVDVRDPVLGIAPPYRLSWCGSQWDGGSIGGMLVGADGDSVGFCWDGRIRGYQREAPSRLGAPPQLLRLHATYPADPSAVPLPAGSAAESTLVAALQLAIDGVLTRAEQDSFYRVYRDPARSREERRALLPAGALDERRFSSVMAALSLVRRVGRRTSPRRRWLVLSPESQRSTKIATRHRRGRVRK